MKAPLLLHLLVASLGFARALQQSNNQAVVSRRQLFSNAAISGVGILAAPAFGSSPARAETATTFDRNQLLSAIATNANDAEIMDIIHNLKDPSGGKTASYPDRLDGEWELIWSYGADGFSPLLTLPKPFKPDSYQYFGSPAAKELGDGRIAQGLTGGILGNNQLWLSSGAIPYSQDPSMLEIQPPFRFQLGGQYGSGKTKTTIVDAGSDEDFRKTNARSRQAQLAGKNLYKQFYVENIGPGSLRVSSVVAGDPVLVGATFVHRKL